MALTSVLNIATSNGAHGIGAALVDGINVTIEAYDKRGMATKTRLPFRELGAANTASLEVNRSYNAYGELASESDARNAAWVTEYKYNNMGRLIEKKAPLVSWTAENGTVATARPTETWYYDRAGRMIGYRDANQNLTTRQLLAGTGYEGTEALVTAEFKPDGGVFRTGYDLFGDARKLTDEIGRIETRSYDNLGRLTQQVHKGGLLTDHYAYDLLGQRIKHWNSWLGAGNVEVTDYDMQGRVTRTVAFGGDATTTSYQWVAGLTNSGMSGSTQIGGWSQLTTYANNLTLTETSDAFGHVLSKNDLGSRTFTYAYDRAGRMTTQAVSGETLTWSYFNTGLASGVTNGGSNYALYEYDAAGNRIYEFTVKNYASVQNAIATYDALGRMTSWVESGNAVNAAANIDWQYDLNGNIRRSTHTFRALNDQGVASSYAQTVSHWFRYDSMNRVTTDQGSLVNGQISGGIRYTWDAAGQRITSTSAQQMSRVLYYYQPDWGQGSWWEHPEDLWGGTWTYMNYNYTGDRKELYTYNGDGTLASVKVDYDTIRGIGQPDPLFEAMDGVYETKADFTYDAMGRMTRQQDWLQSGTGVGYDRQVSYNAKGQIATESIANKRDNDLWTSSVTHNYGSGNGYALGSATSVSTVDSKNNVWQHSTTTTNTYAWWGGAVQSSMTYAKTNDPTYTTYYYYTASGQLSSVYVADGRPRTITYTTDMIGQVLRRDEADNNASQGDPHEVWYRYGGKQLGYVGNNSTVKTDYVRSIANRTGSIPSVQGPFLFGASGGAQYSDFAQSLERFNSYGQGGAGGSYTVRGGDTLRGIAAQLWGDSSLWYKLAEANGLSEASALAEGQNLAIPAGTARSTHNASTFRPYDPSEAIGDTSPTNPKAPKKNKCGVFGAILLVAIAVAVTVVTSGAILAASGAVSGGLSAGISATVGLTGASTGALIGAGAAGAMVGSAVSQGVGVATGMQDKFSWKQVAMAGISGALGAGMGKMMPMANNIWQGAARGAAIGLGTAFVSQTVGVMTGLQKKFDWAGVAGAAIGGAASGAVGTRVQGLNRHVATAISSSAGAIANAATRSLATGTSFGDNLIAAIPDVIGSTLGNMIAGGIQSIGGRAGAGNSANAADAADAAAEAANPLVRLGKDKFQIMVEGEKPFIGTLDEVRSNIEGRIRALGLPAGISDSGGGAVLDGGEFRSGDAVLRYRSDGTGLLSHDVIRNIVHGADAAQALGMWADHFGAEATAYHMAGELAGSHEHILALSQWTAVAALMAPQYATQLATISGHMHAAYGPEIVVTGSRAHANRSQVAQNYLYRRAALESERPGFYAQARATGNAERAATQARVSAALSQADRDIGWLVTLGPMVAAQIVAGGLLARGVGRLAMGASSTFGRSGTVWNHISATQGVYAGTVLPRSFELTVGNSRIWVHGNATKHMAEFATSRLARGVSAETVAVGTQVQLTSLHAAVQSATAQGITYNRLLTVGGWELRFAVPRVSGRLPILTHARPIG